MADKRSATEILLAIEVEIKSLSGRVSNIENLQKIMTSNSNKQLRSSGSIAAQQPVAYQNNSVQTEAPISLGVINKDNFENRPKTSSFSAMAAAQGIDIDESNTTHLEHKITAQPPDPNNFDDMSEAHVRKKSRGQRGNQEPGNKISISQTLNRLDGNNASALFLANVEVMSEDGILINQTRTDTKGRWRSVLAPGDYQVHVSKRFPQDSGKKSIDTTYTINVPPSDIPLELSPLELSGLN